MNPGSFSQRIIFPVFILFLLSGLFMPLHCNASAIKAYEASGRVIDRQTGEPLAFVNIRISGTRSGGVTDIDGFFSLSHSGPIDALLLSYVGYYEKVVELDEQKTGLVISMEPRPIRLPEVTILPGENPAHRIINNTIANRDRNNPENLGSFSYTSYNKFIFTGEFDDGGETRPAPGTDTITDRLSRFLDKQHFLIMESVKERKYRYPGRNNETVLASRISGLQNPEFVLLVTQLQSFSFYDDFINISGNTYLSPLSPGSTNRYFFHLEDTIFSQPSDTVYIISYRPSRGRNFEGLEGLLYINTNGWALQNVIAGPAGETGNTRIRIQQKYELIEGKRWFPTQLNTDFEFLNITELRNFKVIGMGRTYLEDIKLEPPLSRRDFSGFDVTFSPDASVAADAFWNQFRTDTLTRKERNTYHVLDSIGKEHNLDRRVENIEALFDGNLRRGILDINLLHLIGYNKVEGFRPGFGAETNHRLSPVLKFNAHVGYGIKDDVFKYGGGGSIRLHRLSDTWMGYDYLYDREERGGSQFLKTRNLFDPGNLRSFFLGTKDITERHSAWLRFRTLRNALTIKGFAATEEVTIEDGYRFLPAMEKDEIIEEETTKYRFFETGLRMRLAIGEQFILTPNRIMVFGDDVPLLHLNIARGWDDVMEGEFDYWRIEAGYSRNFRFRMAGRQQWNLRGGWVEGEVPWSRLFTASASYRRFAISVPQSFATMRMDEFASDRYIALFWYHNFERLLVNRPNFKPQFLLLTNIGFGSFSNGHQHLNAGFKSMEKGYFESGIAVLDLVGSGFSSLGFEFMLRYGPYAKPDFVDNFSLRLSYAFFF